MSVEGGGGRAWEAAVMAAAATAVMAVLAAVAAVALACKRAAGVA